MPTSFFRSTVAAAAVGVGALTSLGAPAGAQTNCYPPTPGCGPTVQPTTVTTQRPVVVVNRPTRSGSGSTLARTGATVSVVAIVGVGLVAAGMVMKRSSTRSRARTSA